MATRIFEQGRTMSQKAPSKESQDGISFPELIKMFPDDDVARAWFERQQWPDGPFCPHCESFNVQCHARHPSMTHRCRECPNKPFFSVKTGTPMHRSKLGYQIWAVAVCLFKTNSKGLSSMKMHRDLDITQKSAWLLVNKLRKAFEAQSPKLSGIVKIDETE